MSGSLKVRAARLEDGGRCREIDLDEAVRAVRDPGKPVWVDIVVDDDDAAARELLERKMGFHELAVEDALSDRERPALQEYDSTIFLVVPTALSEEDRERYVEIGFFLSPYALVTVSRESTPVLDRTYERWSTRPGHLAHSVANVLHAIVDDIVDGYFLVIDEVEDRVESLSDSLFEGKEGQLAEIVRMKRRLMKLRRVIAPVRDVMNSLLRRDLEAIPDEARRYFQDVMDHVLRIGETVDSFRDALTSMVDIHLSNVSNNLNKIVQRMTVVATVLATMTLVAGVYGMNFDHMPELHWRYGYPFSIALMFGSGAVVLLVFKRMKWL